MREIKTKERDRKPKVLDKASRMPKELARKALLEAKGKVAVSLKEDGTPDERQPGAYAGDQAEAAAKRIAQGAGRGSVRVSYRAGQESAKRVYEKLQKQKLQRKEPPADPKDLTGQMDSAQEPTCGNAKENRKEKGKDKSRESSIKREPEAVGERQAIQEGKGKAAHKETARIRTKERNRLSIRTKKRDRPAFRDRSVREIPAGRGMDGKLAGQTPVKPAPRIVKSSFPTGKRPSGALLVSARKETRAAKAARQAAAISIQRTAVRSQQAAVATVRFKRLAEAAAKTVRNMFAALLAGVAPAFLVLVVIVGAIGGVFSFSASSAQSSASLSAEVLSYTASIQKYAAEYGIPEYTSVIQAIMMQESAGRGTDPMQCSECPYNTQYPNSPGAIQDPEYSIQVGIRYYADCVKEAGCTGPEDLERLKLSLQGYNYGNGYISWALQNYGGYSEANALLFSQQQAAAHGWSAYGDPEYVAHVLQYYSGGNPFAGLFGNEQIVSIALSQLGNAGGQKFWSWYGFSVRESWCACFVSWCADQCGLIESGAMPKFSWCDDGIAWFKAKNQWQAAGSTPTAGMIIFFDWNGDGVCDHTGIVEKSEGGRVYTVEGNSSDAVRQRDYDVNYSCIMGYGVVIC